MTDTHKADDINALITRLNNDPTHADIVAAGAALLPKHGGKSVGLAKTYCSLNSATKALNVVNDAIKDMGGSVMLEPTTSWMNSAPSTACSIVKTR